jgi:hypothetical protein
MAEDRVARIRFPKFAAAATLEGIGEKLYFISELHFLTVLSASSSHSSSQVEKAFSGGLDFRLGQRHA